jgi:hypothetical protein
LLRASESRWERRQETSAGPNFYLPVVQFSGFGSVKNHRANLMGKLGLASRVELVNFAEEHKLP